jgi:hypothetical protein
LKADVDMEKNMEESQEAPRASGPGSFCIPRAALNALLDNKASAYEVCAYLVLARFTDASGVFSTASISAVNRYTGANKQKDGPISRAIERLKTMRVSKVTKVSNGRTGKSHAMVDQAIELGPILYDRDSWQQTGREPLPDGPHERAKVLYVLPDFGEEQGDRVWFGNNLVGGIGGFNLPLKVLKNAGDVAARLLVALYAVNDMETWGGVSPVGKLPGPWNRYEPVDADKNLHGNARLIRAKSQSLVGPGATFSRTWTPPTRNADWWESHNAAGGPVWRALEALQAVGLIYEVVVVLNRNAVKKKFTSGTEYGDIPDDAEPLYELDTRSAHGYKPEGEEGIGGATAKTAGDLGFPVAVDGGRFDGTYAAIVPSGFPAMLAGIFRLRFRVANPKNAGIKGAWARIHQSNREAFELVQAVRKASGLPALAATKASTKQSTSEAA